MDKNLQIIEKNKDKFNMIYENIKNKISKYQAILFYILLVSVILFTFAKVIKTDTNFYSEETIFRWDTVLSYDDIYHARSVYSESKNYEDTVGTIVKHPFISGFGTIVAKIENVFFNNTNPTDHYFHIVVFQIFLNVIGIFYLYKILNEQYKIENKWCFLILTIYELATVTLLGTFIIDSFILSGTLLIMSYYYLSKQKLIVSTFLGIMTTGICITNSIAFAIMAICLLKNKKDILKVGIGCVIGFLGVTILLPYRNYLFNNFLSEVQFQAEGFAAQEKNPVLFLKRTFYYILVSPLFFLNINHEFFYNIIDIVKFDLSANVPIIIATVLYFIFIIFNIIKNIKDRKMLAAFGVFIYNMFIHVIMKFGLHEGTIYGLHFLFAEILMFSFGFKIKNKIFRKIFIICAIFVLFVEIRYNIEGILKLLLLFKNWQ